MDFAYDWKKECWKRTERTTSSVKECSILFGTRRIVIPDPRTEFDKFIAENEELREEEVPTIFYYNDFLPYFRARIDDQIEIYAYEFLGETGWGYLGSEPEDEPVDSGDPPDVIRNKYVRVMHNCLTLPYIHEMHDKMEQMDRRLRQLEAIVEHAAAKSETLREFTELVEEATIHCKTDERK